MDNSQQANSDPVLRYGVWFLVIAMIVGILPLSAAFIYTGKSVEMGVTGIIVCLTIMAGLVLSLRKG